MVNVHLGCPAFLRSGEVIPAKTCEDLIPQPEHRRTSETPWGGFGARTVKPAK